MNKYLKTMKKNYLYGIMIVLIIISIILGYFLYKQHKEYTTAMQNQYNLALYELVDYVQDVENYLAKATITSTPEHGAETLTKVWREANLAQVYLSQLPVSSNELANTAKFLNQVSEYSYSLSRKNIYNEELSQEELDNIKQLYDYSKELKNTLEQLCTDMNEGRISWDELTKNTEMAFATQVDNLSTATFQNLDENFGEYAGLIYDGAFSEHMESAEKKGLIGDEIDEEKAKQIAKEFIGEDKIIELNSNGLIENGNIQVYDFSSKIKDGDTNNPLTISISKTGGHIVNMNYNRDVQAEVISQDEANEIGKEFLNSRGIQNMKETYYLKEAGIVTINYAYEQDEITVYPDLIKLKVALDNGEILGIETSGYLNNHTIRNIPEIKISKEQAKSNLNKNLEIFSEGIAIIPTEWKSEILCYEFKGKINGTDFLVYINAETGREENILIIIDTPNGILTQ
ncbi:MAG: germination protein YpeB [Clostridia bacterium]|nr:germination protein YpeB [Clostridia bacterium]